MAFFAFFFQGKYNNSIGKPFGVNTMTKTLAQQFNDLSKSKGSTNELISFRDQYVVSTGICRTDGSFSCSWIFADGSVWGYGSIFEYETELDNFGHNRIDIYNTIYHQ